MVSYKSIYNTLPLWPRIVLFHIPAPSRTQLVLQHLLERRTVLRKLPDALVQFIERHRLLKQRPAELSLVIDV